MADFSSAEAPQQPPRELLDVGSAWTAAGYGGPPCDCGGSLWSALAEGAGAQEQQPHVSDTLIHSDHGPQYTLWTFSAKVRPAGLVHSLGTLATLSTTQWSSHFGGRMQTELLNRKK